MRAHRGLNYLYKRETWCLCSLLVTRQTNGFINIWMAKDLEVFFLSGERTRPIKIKRMLRPRVGKVDVKRDKCVSLGFRFLLNCWLSMAKSQLYRYM